MKNQKTEMELSRNETESEKTPNWVVVVSAVLVSILFGFCCYYLLGVR